jgi:hypothetical protein
VCIHDSEGRENEHGAHLGKDKIEIARFAVLLRFVVEDDRKKRGKKPPEKTNTIAAKKTVINAPLEYVIRIPTGMRVFPK